MTKAAESKPSVGSTVQSLVSTGFHRLLKVLHHLCLLLPSTSHSRDTYIHIWNPDRSGIAAFMLALQRHY